MHVVGAEKTVLNIFSRKPQLGVKHRAMLNIVIRDYRTAGEALCFRFSISLFLRYLGTWIVAVSFAFYGELLFFIS